MDNVENIIEEKHISFSEIKDWIECSYRHKLKHVLEIHKDSDSVYSCFGTAIHDSCEDYVKTKVMKVELAINIIMESWEKNGFEEVGLWMKRAKNILEYFPGWLEKTFPGWVCVDAEELLYENIPNSNGIKFKGYVDLIIKHNDIIYILDYKTSSIDGWSNYKRNDETTKLQLIYYNIFWSKKHNIDKDKIKCGFLLLNRETGFGGKVPIEFLPLEINEPQRKKSLDIIDNMLVSVNKIAFKAVKDAKFSPCKFCEYNKTEHCW